jgi:hypothetical protein
MGMFGSTRDFERPTMALIIPTPSYTRVSEATISFSYLIMLTMKR